MLVAPAPQYVRSDLLTGEQVSAAVMAFSLLADGTRVRMLWALRERRTGRIEPGRGGGSGLVEGNRRGGRQVFYRQRGGHVRALLAEALFHADQDRPVLWCPGREMGKRNPAGAARTGPTKGNAQPEAPA